ncbi:MAG: hypothetical protein QM632_05790 [Micrococcaceae bacterium]
MTYPWEQYKERRSTFENLSSCFTTSGRSGSVNRIKEESYEGHLITAFFGPGISPDEYKKIIGLCTDARKFLEGRKDVQNRNFKKKLVQMYAAIAKYAKENNIELPEDLDTLLRNLDLLKKKNKVLKCLEQYQYYLYKKQNSSQDLETTVRYLNYYWDLELEKKLPSNHSKEYLLRHTEDFVNNYSDNQDALKFSDYFLKYASKNNLKSRFKDFYISLTHNEQFDSLKKEYKPQLVEIYLEANEYDKIYNQFSSWQEAEKFIEEHATHDIQNQAKLLNLLTFYALKQQSPRLEELFLERLLLVDISVFENNPQLLNQGIKFLKKRSDLLKKNPDWAVLPVKFQLLSADGKDFLKAFYTLKQNNPELIDHNAEIKRIMVLIKLGYLAEAAHVLDTIALNSSQSTELFNYLSEVVKSKPTNNEGMIIFNSQEEVKDFNSLMTHLVKLTDNSNGVVSGKQKQQIHFLVLWSYLAQQPMKNMPRTFSTWLFPYVNNAKELAKQPLWKKYSNNSLVERKRGKV